MKRITVPVEFFGHELGEDGKIARWDKIVEYFYLLESEVDTLRVVDMGPSTLGNPFLAVFISSKENLDNLEYYQELNNRLSNPQEYKEEEIDEALENGKVVILQSMSLHASEIGGTQMAPQLAYEMVSSESEDYLRILSEVIHILVPCFNPDGQLMVTDWYNKYLGTEYEGCSLPWLYHIFAGHDNNRDAFALNLIESQYMADLLFRDWKPQVYQDHHHMGSNGARLFIAPYCDPVRPYADPLIWRELSWYGAHMAYKLEEFGISGVMNNGQFPGWGHFGFHWLTNHHNIVGMLTESASANLASPKYIDPNQLTGSNDKGFPAYQEQTNFPNPWPGGWWHLRDIVEQQMIAAWAVCDLAARNRDTILLNAVNKALRQTFRGFSDPEFAYIIPADQHDYLTMLKFVELLLAQGIKVDQAKNDFFVDNRMYPENSFIVYTGQPKRGVIHHVMGKVLYKDNYYSTRLDGSLMHYDVMADTFGEYMGVDIVAANDVFEADTRMVEEVEYPEIELPDAGVYIIPACFNDSYIIVNSLLREEYRVEKLLEDCDDFEDAFFYSGDFIVYASREVVEPLCQAFGIEAFGVDDDAMEEYDRVDVQQLRIGIFQRYWGGNADEGWTCLLLDDFDYSYHTIMDEDILTGNLRDLIDVLILPSDEYDMLVDPSKSTSPRLKRMMSYYGTSVPPEYRSGFGQEGVDKIVEFVREGGRLVALHQASDFVIRAFNYRIENTVAGLNDRQYSTHGSTLWATLDTEHYIAHGMPDELPILNYDSPILEIKETFDAGKFEVFMRYREQDLLQSGRLVGEDLVKDRPIGIRVEEGRGEVILFAAPIQFRAQTHATFKLLFNCLH